MTSVSVILSTWNNCRRLAVTLDAIAHCRIPSGLDWELVLVDNNCTDETAAVAARFAGRLPLVYVREPRQGLSRGKNAGIRAARGELSIFTDDDVRPCADWIALYWSAFQENGGRCYFGGPIRSEFEGGEPPEEALLRVAQWSITGLDFGGERRFLGTGEHFLGANWACSTEALRAVGGYHVGLGLDASLGRRRVGEEFELMERLHQRGMRPLYLPEASILHFVPKAKCRLGYIADNTRAHGNYSLHARTPLYSLESRSRLKAWLGEERWSLAAAARLCTATAFLGLSWIAARLTGSKGYAEYLSLWFCLGRLEAYLQELRGARRTAGPDAGRARNDGALDRS